MAGVTPNIPSLRGARLKSGVMPQENLLPPLELPDLSDLPAQSEWMALRRGLAGGGSKDHTAYTLQANCVRLLDAALRDYDFGRHEIAQFHARPPSAFGLTSLIAASSHFESCIWHLERFIKHARALRALKSAETELKQIIPKGLSIFEPSVESRITALRHMVSHLERAAQRGELPPGTSIMPMCREHGLTLSQYVIGWDELAQWLRDAHECVSNIAKFVPSDTRPGA
jgi:hypothetical protein